MTPTELLARQREMEQAASDHLQRCIDLVVASDPQRGHSRERQRGWDEAIATVSVLIVAARHDRALLLDVVAAADNLSAEDDKDSEAYSPDRIDRCRDALRDALDALFATWEAAR